MAHINVSGTWGTLIADAESGVVEKAPTTYADITKFDVAEWTKTYGKAPAGEIDILDIGYWSTAGLYIEPDDYHRDMMNQGWGSIVANEAAGMVLRQ